MNALDTFFSWTLGASLRASLLAIAVLAVQTALRGRFSARGRYALWLPVLFVLIMPVLPESRWSAEHLLTTPAPTFDVPVADGAVMFESTPATVIGASAISERRWIAPAATIDWRQVMVIVWLVGVLGCLIGGVGFYLAMMRRIRMASVPASASLIALVQTLSESIMLRRSPLVRVSSRVESPAVAGLRHPVLLLPVDFESAFSHAEAALILKHELMHLKRADLPVNALLCVLQALHWFNPLLWFVGARVRQDRESACDAQVLASDERDCRSDYGHALLKVQSAYCPRGFSLGFVGIFGSTAAVRARIEAIAKYRRVHPVMAWLVTLLICGLGLVGATRAQTEKAPDKAETKMPSDKTMTQMKERFDAYKSLLDEVQKLQKESQDPVLSAEARAKAAEAFASKLKEARELEKEIKEQQERRASELKQELAQTLARPVASVNGKLIAASDLTDAITAQQQTIRMQYRDHPKLADEALAKLKTTALDSLIDRELILAEFKKMGGTIKPEFVDQDIDKLVQEQFKGDRERLIAELVRSRMTMEKFRELREKMIIVQVMRSRQSGKPVQPTEAEIDAYIQTHAAEWPEKDRISISTITIPKYTKDKQAAVEKQKALADDLSAQLVAGADFATLARKHSQDSRASQGGEWPVMEFNALSPALRSAVITIKAGEVPVVDEASAFILFKINGLDLIDFATLKEIYRDEFVRRLKAAQGKAKVDEWLAGLRQRAQIETF